MNLIKTHKERFLAIDANAIIHRAFHAYPSNLQTEDGVQVNAAYGFSVMLLSALKTFEPKYLVCCFDTHKPTFRHDEYPEYKATRKPTDQSLIDQFPMVEEILKAFNIPIVKKEGFEADDILGTIAKSIDRGKWSRESLELYILSGDRDLLQLVGGDVKVCLPSGNFKNLVAYDREETFKYLGLYPEQVVDYKAIAGDPSDNIPGIKGIGNKTAQELLSRYGDLDSIYKNLKDIKPRYANLLTEGVEQAELSRKLAKIEQEVGINIHLEDSLLKDFDKKMVLEVFKKYSFKSLIPKIDEVKEDIEDKYSSQLNIFSQGNQSEIVWNEVSDLKKKLKSCSRVTMAFIEGQESSTGESFVLLRIVDKSNEQVDYILKDFSKTETPNCETTLYGLEDNVSQVPLNSASESFDISLFAHMINSERRGYTLKDLSFDYAKQILDTKISPMDRKIVLDTIEEIKEKQTEISNEIELYDYTRKNIIEDLGIEKDLLLNVLRKIEIPTSYILHKMEERGIKIDTEKLERLGKRLSQKINKISQEIYDSIGHEFNINSPKQLSDILFNELKLPSIKKKSTNEFVLNQLKGTHPCVERILEYRELTKVQNTYVTPLLEMAKDNPDQSIHTDFKQTGTTSGRLSSSNPNMQNIPLQGEWAEELRKTFIAREGFKLIAMDYSQIELRIMADISKDNLLIKDFSDGLDIHTSTASRLLNKEMEEITKKERGIGKTVNFGILFGQTAFGLSNLMNIDTKVASEYIQSYFDHYKGVEQYIRSLEREAYKRGFVQTMFGTTRNIRGLKSKNIRMQKAAQREAINMPIQGSEADIMKLAMIELDEMIEEYFNGKAYMILQVHDELIFEVKEEIVEEFTKKAKEIMENTVNLEVPLLVSSSIGNNLSELK